MVHPREVFKASILSNANSVICIHNHPGGDVT
ncbi:MAG: DNA repair protein RadC, partial [Lachnospiraceae bacterium]|nr:DNA repair protein RadC [Lachnospiraceae bacterium]